MTRPRWRYLGLVWLGGCIGTLLRASIGVALGGLPTGWVVWPTLLVNVTGAFAIGALYEYLTLASADGRQRRGVRLFLGTGILGGFTTYSALAVQVAAGGAAAAAYGLLTLGAGVAGCWLGIQAGAAISPARPSLDEAAMEDSL